MTTFTLQDLNLPATAEQAVEQVTKEKWMEYGMNNPISTSAIDHATQHAPEPQPTPNLADIINTICTQLQLLTTVISQSKAQPDTTPPETGTNVPTLQDTIALTLQQAGWFKEMVGACIDEDMVIEGVKDCVEREVETYFDYRFDVNKHFDFEDAVSNEVHDRLEDAVRDQVEDKLEEVVAEKLSEASVSISF